jgi:hypothetical protein
LKQIVFCALQALLSLIYTIIDANGMGTSSGVHIRLMVSRGLKSTPYQNPKVTLGKPTIVILPEWKEAAPGEPCYEYTVVFQEQMVTTCLWYGGSCS